jgi:hypothetical protein
MPINPISATLLHNGQVLIVSGSENDGSNYDSSSGSQSYRNAIWNPAGTTQSSITVKGFNYDVFCSGTVALPDGRTIIIGGTSSYAFTGDNRASIFDPATGLFAQTASMVDGRWYATATELGDGRVATLSGLNNSGGTNNTVEMYDLRKAGDGWTSPVTAPFTNPPLYPRMFLLPNGKVFFNGQGSSPGIANAWIMDPASVTWTMSVATTQDRQYGSAVLLPLLPPGYTPKVMNFGGGSPATNSTEIIDLSAATPTWTAGPGMSTGRIEMNAVILPNGKVLAEGGSVTDEVPDTSGLAADLYDPVTNTMSSGGKAAYSRLYHSTALLLPDATVASMGSNPPPRGEYEPAIEIYTPPYLFDSNDNPITNRPVITGVSPAVMGYNKPFTVTYTSAKPIASAVLIRPGSVTHAFDMEQRLVGLCGASPQPACSGSGALSLTSPPNSNIAPPGYYMLFLLDNSGVPSVAQFIQLTPYTTTPPTGSIQAPTSNVTVTAGGSVSFSGSSSAGGGQYSWVFPNGSPGTSNVQNPGSVTFANPGVNVASLTVIDGAGNSDPNPPTRTITVLPATPDFSISVTPLSNAVVPGGSTTFTVNVQPQAGFTGTVSLSVGSENGFPAGVSSGGFSPPSINGSGSATLTINTTTSATPYALSLTITGLSGSLTHIASTTLLINLAAPTGLTAAPGSGQVALSWAGVSGATGYHVKRSVVNGGPYIGVACPTSTAYTDAGLTNGTTYYYVVSADYSGGPLLGAESGDSGQVSATPSGGSSFNPIRVNAGGSAYTDSLGRAWSADTGFSAGSTYATAAAVTGTADPTLYQSERYGALQYQFSVPSGAYTVTLKYAEIYFTSTGQRVFNVKINGAAVQTNFDIVAAAGGANKAIDLNFPVTSSGTITIQFTAVTDNPKISAIQIVQASGITVSVSPPTATLGQSQTQLFSATVTGSTNTAVTWSLVPAGVGSISTGGLYTAPASITASQQVTVKAVSNADGVTSGTATVTLNPPGGTFTPIRVNAGGSAYTDSLGRAWSADTGFSAGSTYATAAAVTGTADPTLYQSERYGALQYQFSVPSGSYTVTLKYAEIYFTSTGQRMFNVSINGAAVQTNFDIVAAAGGANKAIDVNFPVTSSGTITIQFTTVVDFPKISAIQIVQASGITVSVSPPTATLGQSQTQLFSATVTGSTNTGVTWSLVPAGVGAISTGGLYTAPASIPASQQVTVKATSNADGVSSGTATVTLNPPGGTFTPIRVNCGGPAYTDSLGKAWSADTGFSAGNTYATGAGIAGTADPTLYQSERYGAMQYQFSVPSGSYTVTLKYAEIYFTSTGQRMFNVSINGAAVQTNFDIVAAAGGANKAIDVNFPVTSSGTITIQFTTVVDFPKISAIQIVQASGITVSVSPPTATLGQSQTQLFSATVTGSTSTGVTWSLVPAGVGSISTGGLYTAPASIPASQQVTVKATSNADGVSSGTATVTLNPPGGTFTPIRVNCGGPAYTDLLGKAWSADTGFSAGNTYATGAGIAGTADPTLYQSERYGAMQYQFSVPSGSYTVTLKYAEIYFTSTGQRMFNVSINGTAVQTNFDIVAAAGGANKAIDVNFPVTSSGTITIQFTTVIDFPKVSAIQIAQ